MPGSYSYSVSVDREGGVFEGSVDYAIDGYYDPETGEYFGDTYWSVFFDSGFGMSGYSGESGNVPFSLGFHGGETVATVGVQFSAENRFTGEGVAFELTFHEAGLAGSAQTITGNAGIDVIVSGAGADTISAGGEDDLIYAGDGADTIFGGAGADRIDGEGGNDAMSGGAGDDTYYVGSWGDTVIEAADEGADTVYASVNFTLADHVETLILTGTGNTVGRGNDTGSRIFGNAGLNYLYGGTGNDTLAGGASDDRLFGGAGNDLLDGGADLDTMAGGAGDDTYVVENVLDQVIERAGDGLDTVVTSLTSYTLGRNVENLDLVATAGSTGRGNALDNVVTSFLGDDTLIGGLGDDTLIGNAGDDVLIGGGGADMLEGGIGSDTADYSAARSGVVASLAPVVATLAIVAAEDEAAGDTYLSVENLVGSSFDDRLTGDANANVLQGGGGADTIDGGEGDDTIVGGGGADTLTGGDGSDTLSYARSLGPVTANLATGIFTGGDADGDMVSGFENLLGGIRNDVLTGNGGANFIGGGDGRDLIDAGGGDDVIEGGAGADDLRGGAGMDVLSYKRSAGAVTVNLATQTASGGDAAGDFFRGFEGVHGGLGDDTLVGNDAANEMLGGGGKDTISGAGGRDTISGGAGADVLDGGDGYDTLSYADAGGSVSVSLESGGGFFGDALGDQVSNFERLVGSAFNDGLYGSNAADAIAGGAGSDSINGRGGDDRLFGGAGGDLFYVNEGTGSDTVLDFGAGDLIALELGPDFDSFSEAMIAYRQEGADAVFTFTADTQIILAGVDGSTLTAADFYFGDTFE